MKKNDFLCPKCKGHLNAGGFVIFSTKNKKNKRGLILLNPNIGSYTYRHHDDYRFEDGEMVDFFCPICGTDLKSPQNKDYAGILMVDEENIDYKVLFSRKAGEKSTYVLSNDEVEVFGDDSKDYDDMIGEQE